jgi:RNA polymerase sigma-70 factor, ECF subfamily
MYDSDCDDLLISKAAKGDVGAFDAVVRRHQDRIQRFATRMFGGDVGRGADASVGAFVRLWEHRFAYEACGSLVSWLLTATYRLCLDELAKQRPTVPIDGDGLQLADAGASPSQTAEQGALADAVRNAIMELPPSHRAVLVLSVYEGIGYLRISEILGIPIGTVASRKNQAIALLKRRLAAWEEQ